MYPKQLVSIVGNMPNNVFPLNVDHGLDVVYLYHRDDNKLYLYDPTPAFEFSLLDMPIVESQYCVINPFHYV